MTVAKTEAAKPDAAKRSTLYSEALSELREKHEPEFQQILGRKYADAGFTYKPRLTPEQRQAKERAEKLAAARKRAAKLLEDYPELRAEFTPERLVTLAATDGSASSDVIVAGDIVTTADGVSTIYI